MQEGLQDWFGTNEKFAGMSLSIGIRPACGRDVPLEQLIREADQAMYAAKRGGKAQARVWDPEKERI